jgi:Na+/citrate or Na+/malate symporter
MRPLAMLLGVILGSTVSITAALTLTLVVLLFLPEYAGQIGEEFPPLLRTLAGSAVLAAIAGLGFYGELRERPWRRHPQFVLYLLLALIGWWYWPTGQM